MEEISDPSEIPEEQRATLAGQATRRILARMSELETSFKQRLGEPLTELDRGGALADMTTALANEIISLWGAFETLARQLGIEEFDVGPKD